MSEAPEKTWIHNAFWGSGDGSYWARDEREGAEATQYIRADIVNELVEALETCTTYTYMDIDGDWVTQQKFDFDKAKAALRKARGEKDE